MRRTGDDMARKKKLPSGMWKRGNTYYARFRAHGQQVRERLSTNLEVATTMLTELRMKAYRQGKETLEMCA